MIRAAYKAVIGLEVHAQIKTNSKLFSYGGSNYFSPPNTQLDLFDIALPGTLPVLNRACVDAAIKTSLALNCTIQSESHFDRKHYFYTDLPAGYQITQYHRPISKDGYLEFVVQPWWTPQVQTGPFDLVQFMLNDRLKGQILPKSYVKRSKIKQIQLEQDSAKSFHENLGGESFSLVDYNRSGVALMELVFEPDLVDHYEATGLVRELILLLKSIDTCECKLDEGSLRVDANISIKSIEGKSINDDVAGRVELKNVNSLRALSRCIEYEVERQVTTLKSGGIVTRETRTLDAKKTKTVVLRKKEEAQDYRYIPEPSLPCLRFDGDISDDGQIFTHEYKSQMPKLPASIRYELEEKFSVCQEIIPDLMRHEGLATFLVSTIELCQSCKDSSLIAKFLMHIGQQLTEEHKELTRLNYCENLFGGIIGPEIFASVLDLVNNNKLTFSGASKIIAEYLVRGRASTMQSPIDLIKKLNLEIITDEDAIDEKCRNVIDRMKGVAKKYTKTGGAVQMRDFVEKLHHETNGRIPVEMAIKKFDLILRGN